MQVERYEVADGMIYLVDPDLGLNIREPFGLPRLPGVGERETCSLEGLEVIWNRSEEGHLEMGCLKKEGYFHGQYLQFHPCGKIKGESFYKEGKLHGLSYFVSSQGVTLSLTWFYEGFPIGKAKQFYASGNLYSLQQYVKGKLQGKQEYFYEDSLPKTSLFYHEGELEGEVMLFWPSGQMKRRSVFEKGLRNGQDVIWSSDGIILDEGEYLSGNPIGKHQRRYDSGVLREEKTYHSPNRFDLSTWDEQGRLTSEGIYSKDLSFKETKVSWPEGTSQTREGAWDGSRICWK